MMCHVAALLCVLQSRQILGTGPDPADAQRADAVTPAVVINAPQPDSVRLTDHFEYQGKVVLQIEVDERGNVTHVEVKKPLGFGLDEKAVAGVRTWKFKPATWNGQPTRTRIMVEVNFRLAHSPHHNAQCPVPFAFGTMDSNDPKKLVWEDLSNEVDHWWTQ